MRNSCANLTRLADAPSRVGAPTRIADAAGSWLLAAGPTTAMSPPDAPRSIRSTPVSVPRLDGVDSAHVRGSRPVLRLLTGSAGAHDPVYGNIANMQL